MRVLVLHGNRQTAEMAKSLYREFVRIVGDRAEFFFLDAPYEHPESGRQWFPENLQIEDIGKIRLEEVTIDRTLDLIEEEIREKKIDVLVGFSQGGNVVDTYLRLRNRDSLLRAVIYSGYSFVNDQYTPITFPVLNVVGENDEIVPCCYAPVFLPEREPIKHTRGHQLPTSKPLLRQIAAFLLG